MKILATMFGLGLVLCVSGSAQQSTHPNDESTQKMLRDACVAFERAEVATDTNDFSHLKNTDLMDGRYCQGLIHGFELGANHTVYVLAEPKRLEILTSQHTVRQIAKAVVAFIDEHPDETDLRNILLGALQEVHAAAFVGNIKMQDLTPDCPKDWKDIPTGGCSLKAPPDAK